MAIEAILDIRVEVQILDGSKEKQRKFLETVALACPKPRGSQPNPRMIWAWAADKKTRPCQVELQIGLKDYDTQRDKRFAGNRKATAQCQLFCNISTN